MSHDSQLIGHCVTSISCNISESVSVYPVPRGPKDQKKMRFRARLKILSENEIFERAVHRGHFLWGNRDVEIEIFERDQKFRSRSHISIEIKFF